MEHKPTPRTMREAFGAASSLCTGNCNQGRGCDCMPAVELDEPPRGRLPAAEAIALALVYTISAAMVIAVGVHVWARFA